MAIFNLVQQLDVLNILLEVLGLEHYEERKKAIIHTLEIDTVRNVNSNHVPVTRKLTDDSD